MTTRSFDTGRMAHAVFITAGTTSLAYTSQSKFSIIWFDLFKDGSSLSFIVDFFLTFRNHRAPFLWQAFTLFRMFPLVSFLFFVYRRSVVTQVYFLTFCYHIRTTLHIFLTLICSKYISHPLVQISLLALCVATSYSHHSVVAASFVALHSSGLGSN